MTKRWLTEDQLSQLPPAMTGRALGKAPAKPKPKGKAANTEQMPALAPAVATSRPTAKQTMQAKGRLPKGTMNATETKYATYLDQLRLAGEVLWWKFEGITLTLAPRTTLTVDFAVMLACGALEMHDVKGSKAIYEDDARAKMKIAAQMFPWPFRVVYPAAKGAGGGWDIEVVRE